LSAKTATRSHSKQPRLLALAVLFLFFQTAALSLANGTRLHSEQLQPDWLVFVPFFVWLGGILALHKAIKTQTAKPRSLDFPNFRGFGRMGHADRLASFTKPGAKSSLAGSWWLVFCFGWVSGRTA